MTAISKAIELAGSGAALGAMLNPPVSYQAVMVWNRRGWCPPARAKEITALYPELRLRDLLKPALVAALS